MSIEQLIKISKMEVDYNDPAVQKRFAEARKRQNEYDREIEARVKARIPTREALNRVIDL